MDDNFKYVINMANSIIGVSILSMPYCFREVGLVLGVILLLFCGFITKKTCMFLVRSAIMARRGSYELLAFQVFGVSGKLFMELCMILFLLGICISFHVVMGDLAPAIVAKYMIIENSPSLRCTLLVGIVILVILPLCLFRNIDSLASVSACSIGFYVFLNAVVFYVALPRLISGSWIHTAEFFHLEKAFKVLPIMLLALACQSNVFEIYSSIPDPDVYKMHSVVNQATNICCALYICLGFLGYVAFNDKDIGGNIIMSFPTSNMTDGITMFFVISLALSFPLVMFPCRTSIHSLLYKRNVQISSYDSFGNFIPEVRFKIITASTLFISLVIGILIPNIEFVLGLLGSTMGMWISIVLPSVFFIRVYTKLSGDRLLAQFFLFLGFSLMVTGTYLHLNNFKVDSKGVTAPPLMIKEDVIEVNKVPETLLKSTGNEDEQLSEKEEVLRKEPVNPEPPPGSAEVPKESKSNPDIEKAPALVSSEPDVKHNKPSKKPNAEKALVDDSPIESRPQKRIVKPEILHPDAIKKEEKENAIEEKNNGEDEDLKKKQNEILQKLEEHQKEQEKILETQKEILQVLKDHKDQIETDAVEKPQEEVVQEAAKQDNSQLNENIVSVSNVESKKEEVSADSKDMQKGNLVNDAQLDKKDLLKNYVKTHIKKKREKKVNNKENKVKDKIPKGDDKSDKHEIKHHKREFIEDEIPSPDKNINEALLPAIEQIENKLPSAKENLNDNGERVVEARVAPLEERVREDKVSPINGIPIEMSEPKKLSSEQVILPTNERVVRKVSEAEVNNAELSVKNPAKEAKQPISRHDEERKKRSVVLQPPEVKELDTPNIVGDEKLQPDIPAYDTRHLLWNQKKTRRRKRRNNDYPDYWEEM